MTAGETSTPAHFFYMATVNTPAMALKMVGVGSQYAFGDRDHDGNYLDGGKTYHLNIPAHPPAKDFCVGRCLRPPDTLRAADRTAIAQQEQQTRSTHHQRGRLG